MPRPGCHPGGSLTINRISDGNPFPLDGHCSQAVHQPLFPAPHSSPHPTLPRTPPTTTSPKATPPAMTLPATTPSATIPPIATSPATTLSATTPSTATPPTATSPMVTPPQPENRKACQCAPEDATGPVSMLRQPKLSGKASRCAIGAVQRVLRCSANFGLGPWKGKQA